MLTEERVDYRPYDGPILDEEQVAEVIGAQPGDRIAIFGDGSNVFYTQRAMNWNLDPVKLKNLIGAAGKVTNMYWYAPIKDQADQKGFFLALINAGITVRNKLVKAYYDSAKNQTFQKGNMDIELVTDALLTMSQYDIIVLLSGDNDYAYALEKIRAMGKRIVVVSCVRTGMMGSELRNVCDAFLDLDSIRPIIEKDPKPGEEAVPAEKQEYSRPIKRPTSRREEVKSHVMRRDDRSVSKPRIVEPEVKTEPKVRVNEAGQWVDEEGYIIAKPAPRSK